VHKSVYLGIMRIKQSGFSLTVLVVCLVATGAIALAGYMVWQKQQTKQTTKETSTVKPVNRAATPTYSGSTLKLPLLSLDSSASSHVAFVVPDGWVASKGSSMGGYFFADELTYTPGTAFSRSEQANTRDIERFMLSVTGADEVPDEYKSYKKTDYGTVNGNKATMYTYEFSKGEHIGNVQMQGGEKEYMYFITKGDDAVMVSYYVFADDKDQLQLIKQVIQTITF
jgi:hypothetical protein